MRYFIPSHNILQSLPLVRLHHHIRLPANRHALHGRAGREGERRDPGEEHVVFSCLLFNKAVESSQEERGRNTSSISTNHFSIASTCSLPLIPNIACGKPSKLFSRNCNALVPDRQVKLPF